MTQHPPPTLSEQSEESVGGGATPIQSNNRIGRCMYMSTITESDLTQLVAAVITAMTEVDTPESTPVPATTQDRSAITPSMIRYRSAVAGTTASSRTY